MAAPAVPAPDPAARPTATPDAWIGPPPTGLTLADGAPLTGSDPLADAGTDVLPAAPQPATSITATTEMSMQRRANGRLLDRSNACIGPTPWHGRAAERLAHSDG